MAGLSPASAERHLASQLRIQGDTLLRKGIQADVIEAERAALSAAVRAELLRIAIGQGGVA